jgi:membrane protease YdiL (CAAX protease family)
VFLTISIAPAIVEELTFRGLIQSSLERVFSVRDALLIQAALFGILHLLPFMFPSHFLMGLCFGFLRNRSRSLYPGMLMHAAWNAWVISSELHRW